jgi:hypothetical protein
MIKSITELPEHHKKMFKRLEMMKESRRTFDGHFQRVADYVLPTRMDFVVDFPSSGTRRRRKIYDGTAVLANQKMAAALQGMLTNPSEAWFSLRVTSNESLNENENVKFWLQDARTRMMTILNSPEANFDAQNHEVYLDLGAWGSSVMFSGEVLGSSVPLHYRTIPLSECFFDENNAGMVDTLFREWKWTLRQVVQEFGYKILSDDSKEMWDKGKIDERVTLVNFCLPIEESREKLPNRQFSYASLIFELKTKHFIRLRGFHEFPYFTPRWTKLTGEKYGRSPSMAVLPDILMANEMMKTIIKSAQKAVDPPLQIPDEGLLTPVRMQPGGANYYRAGSPDRIEALTTGANVGLGVELLDRTREAIKQGYFVDLLELPDRPKSHQEMREAEVLTRREDQRLLMTPVLTRLQREYFGPVIKRTFNVAFRAGYFLPMPFELAQQNLEIEYVSPAVRAQKTLQADALGKFFQVAAPMIQLDPSVMDNINQDAATRWLMKLTELPSLAFNTLDTVSGIREERAEKERQQEQLVAAESISKSLSNVSDLGAQGAPE